MLKYIWKCVSRHKEIKKFYIPTKKELGYSNAITIHNDNEKIMEHCTINTSLDFIGYRVRYSKYYMDLKSNQPYDKHIDKYFRKYEEMVKFVKQIRKLNKDEYIKYVDINGIKQTY